MPRCPHCGAEISYLYHYCKEYTKYMFELDGEEPSYVYLDTDYAEAEEWTCPHCEKVIATTEEEAIKFLKGSAEKSP